MDVKIKKKKYCVFIIRETSNSAFRCTVCLFDLVKTFYGKL